MPLTLVATTTMGFEATLKHELKALGYTDFATQDGKVEFTGELPDICTSNLWLRTAGRIYLKIGEFKATTFDELYDQTKALPWGEWIQANDQFPISKITSKKSTLFAKSKSQAIVKKAIVDSLKAHHNTRILTETGAVFAIRVQIHNDLVTLSIDTTGDGLNKRGYRAHNDIAPLRETLAAGLISLARWRPNEEVLLDPMCGTGTILIEAGLMAHNIAPGLGRQFASESWKVIPRQTWDTARKDAKAQIKPDAPCRIYGSDINGRALSIARKNIKIAGLADIHVQTLPLSDIRSRFERGKIITNPPYGERLSDETQVNALYTEMGRIFQSQFPDWSYYIITPSDDFESVFGQKSTKHRKVYNGGIKCWFHQYH